MEGIISDNGKWRKGSVGIYKDGKTVDVAPSANKVGDLMDDLCSYLENRDDPWLIKACVFHYELEFIHPFSDGNGKMGRLWQQILLMQEDPLFEYVPVKAVL